MILSLKDQSKKSMNENKKLTRIKGGYSERNNLSSFPSEIQLNEFTQDTRIKLKNSCLFLLEIYKQYLKCNPLSKEQNIAQFFACQVFNISWDSDECNYKNMMGRFSKVFDEGTYNEILDVIEWVAKTFRFPDPNKPSKYFDSPNFLNSVFESENIGYRFIEGIIVPITNELEIEEISKAINGLDDKEGLTKSLLYLSDKSKDYQNSIKESVSSLEQFVCRYTTQNTLGAAIEELASKLPVHKKLKESIKDLYKFASDEDGIRHRNDKANHTVSYNEAKFILVLCSSLINYLRPYADELKN